MKALTPILLFLAAIAAFFYYIKPGYATIQQLQVQNKQYDVALEKAEEFAIKRDELNDQLNQFKKEDLQRLERMIPDNIDSTRLIIEIDQIAKKYASGITGIRVDDGQSSGGATPSSLPYNVVTIGFGIKATYEDFNDFLKDIEVNLRLSDAAVVSFTPGADGSAVHTFSMTIKTYWLKPVQ
ncbi:MAG TPA: type 4a pilus biogenesis protein PilO [Candidatus Paceibacterota bacterium]|nr:type 4a pilus biogenesis protein PilO [Candidatus Paceibacterota bacterium]